MILLNAVSVAIIFKLIVAVYSNGRFNEAEKMTGYWYEKGRRDLRASEQLRYIHKEARNAILFLGDGMSISTVTAARILKGQLKGGTGEESSLFFEGFPYVSLIKTYNVDKQVPDSAGTATAFLTGVKANYQTLGINAQVQSSNENCDEILSSSVPSILKWAIDEGKSAGIVTTTRITHATPGAGYAHVAHRDWESDSDLPLSLDPKCKDIARQLVEDEPGIKLSVILGGGRRNFLPKGTPDHYNQSLIGLRSDDQNLIENWKKHKETQVGTGHYAFVNSSQSLRSVDYDKTEYLLGLFNYNHINYDPERTDEEPSLKEMAEAALKILQKNPKGYVLLIEGGRIDHAHHDNYGNLALRETLAFDGTIESVTHMVDPSETLMVVTADHSHTLTINGYPERGTPISGFSNENETLTNMPFTTLMYGNGPGNTSPRKWPENTDGLRYQHHSAVHLVESAHGGEDVGLYAVGPMAHLFHGNHDQTYVAHVLSYATCIGNYRMEKHCSRFGRSSGCSRLKCSGMVASNSRNLIMLASLLLTTFLAI